eukprot:1498481-Lingulodinium_polyedra.AAC.1
MPRYGAFDSPFRARSSSRIARERAPCSDRFCGSRVERASVRFASRCDHETSIRTRRNAAFQKRCVMTRSTRRFAVAAARK